VLIIVIAAACSPTDSFWKDTPPPAPIDKTEDFWSKIDGLYQNPSGAQIQFNKNERTFKYYAPSKSFWPYLLDSEKMKELVRGGKSVCAHEAEGAVLKYAQRIGFFDQPSEEFYLELEFKGKTTYFSKEIEKYNELEESPKGFAKFTCKRFFYSALNLNYNSLKLTTYDPKKIEFNDDEVTKISNKKLRELFSENLVFYHVDQP